MKLKSDNFKMTNEYLAMKFYSNTQMARVLTSKYIDWFIRVIEGPYDPMKNYPNREFNFRSQCRDKVKYPSWKEANVESIRLRKQTRNRFHPYKCGYCNQWHVGRKRME